MAQWIARAEYEDGLTIEKTFTYAECGNYVLENQRQYELESWLLSQHDGCVFYSVDFECDDDQLTVVP